MFRKTASQPRTCPECGADLTDSSPVAPCPACLMQLGMQAWTAAPGRTGSNLEPTFAGTGPGFTGAANHQMDPVIAKLTPLFPQLEILHLVGQGGMGSVYCARQKSLDRLVALKVIKPDSQNRELFADRFTREARALAKLNHQNIITVHDFGQIDDLYYFVMEYVDGINLRQMLQGQRLTPRQALEIVPAVCDALQYAHDNGIVHRDIKPENILIDTEGKIKIADFGLAKLLNKEAVGPTLTRAHDVMGTMHYMAPEQIEKPLTVDHRADIYSLGVVIYELLTGELPLGRFQPPSQKVTIDVRLDEIVLHTLEKEPSLRYQKVSDLKSDMASVSSDKYSEQSQPAYANANHDPNASYQQNANQQYANQRPPASYGNAPAPPYKSKPHKSPTVELPGPIPHNGFWGVASSNQSYKNLLYLLMSFPLGIIYFVLLMVGLSVGIGTVIVWVGLFVLLGTFLLVHGLMAFEKKLAASLLNTSVASSAQSGDNRQLKPFDRAKKLFVNKRTWIGVAYLFGKFPLGIVSFVLLVTLLTIPLAFISSVVLVQFTWADLGIDDWRIDSIPEATVAACFGVFLFFPFLHALNGVAWLHSKWARLCLSQ